MVILFWTFSQPAHATVFNIADGDVAGFANAINSANGTVVEDTINLATNGTYTLTSINNITGAGELGGGIYNKGTANVTGSTLKNIMSDKRHTMQCCVRIGAFSL